MNIYLLPARRKSAYVILVTMVFVVMGALLLMSALNWTSASSRNTARNNEYYTSAAAAEAATEKAFIHISRDYLNGGEGNVYANLSTYCTLVPTSAENTNWANYTFTNAVTGTSGIYVDRSQPSQYTVLNGQYSGLYGQQAIYRVVSDVIENDGTAQGVVASVQENLGVESIPLFQFAIFYNQDLEMNPSPPMVVNGRVHANGNIYTVPASSLTFSNDVTCSGNINLTAKPGDPNGQRGVSFPNVIYCGEHDGGTSTLNLPGGSSNVYSILQAPTNGGPMNTNLLYNKADMLITINATNSVVMRSGPNLNGFWGSSTTYTNFLSFGTLFDFRQNMTNAIAILDIGKLNAWINSANNGLVPPLLLGHSTLNLIWVQNLITNGGAYQPAIFVTNGAQLPVSGLTIATPDPLYVCGDYNTTLDFTNYSRLGINATTYTRPASFMADAISVLSGNWTNSSSATTLANRTATATTINAAFLTGISPTGYYSGSYGSGSYYSGGVENFPRYLENWSNVGVYINGSMVTMFNSQIATIPIGAYGATGYIYNPPNRYYAFDQNFTNNAKLPPGTPQILFLERLSWALQAPGVLGN